MHCIEVGTVVDSILAAFANAADVLRRIKNETKVRKIKRPGGADDHERQLQQVLAQGSIQIRSQFDQSVAKHGRYFVVGDAFTQTKLAQTLLTLNNGLIEIMNLLLAKKSSLRMFPAQSLLSLSRSATYDTVDALQMLDERLSIRAESTSAALKADRGRKPTKQARAGKERKVQPLPNDTSSEQNPLLVRGGWVKTKSGDFIVVSAEGARKRAAQKADKKRGTPIKRTPEQGRIAQKMNRGIGAISDAKAYVREKGPAQTPALEEQAVVIAPVDYSNPPMYEMQRPPSLFLVSAEVFDQANTMIECLPPRPPKIPLHIRPNPNVRQRPASGITFMTVSTKMGEIPEDKLPDRRISPEELIHRPLPYDIPPSLLQPPQKTRKGFWRFKLKG